MNIKIRVLILGAAFACALAPNLAVLVKSELALSRPEVWKFHIAGFDPYDPFRGRYVNFSVPALEQPPDYAVLHELPAGKTLYAVLSSDDSGFAYISDILLSKPDGTESWLTLRSAGFGHIEPHFTRYYASPSRADVLDSELGRSGQESFILMRVYRGTGVITGIGFGPQAVESFMEDEQY